MKYKKPGIIKLTSQAEMWCNTGSNGENCCNDCGPGGTPATTQTRQSCWTGNYNSSGHCISGSNVSNDGAATFCYKGTGATGNYDKNCIGGTGAFGGIYGLAACHLGTQACHCYTGQSA